VPDTRDRREYNKKFRETHKEYFIAYERNRPNKVERLAKAREWGKLNKEWRKHYNDAYREANLERLRAFDRARHAARHEYRLAYFRKLKAEVIREYGSLCKCCGEDTFEFMSIDHINNDGARHREEAKCGGGSTFYLWLKRNKFPKDNFQLLCFNCNYAKHRYGICPHQRVLGAEVSA